jgi:hypothetical protein
MFFVLISDTIFCELCDFFFVSFVVKLKPQRTQSFLHKGHNCYKLFVFLIKIFCKGNAQFYILQQKTDKTHKKTDEKSFLSVKYLCHSREGGNLLVSLQYGDSRLRGNDTIFCFLLFQ